MYKTIFYTFTIVLVISCNSNNDTPTQRVSHVDVNSGYDTLHMGKETFEEKCTLCHGDDGRLGSMGAKILPDTKKTLEEMITQVKHGKNVMPAFQQVLTEDQIIAVAKYVRTLKDTLK